MVPALLLTGTAIADMTYTDPVNVFKVIDNGILYPWDPLYTSWSHVNPFPGDYEAALDAGQISGASLTIVADDVDLGHEVNIRFIDKYGNPHDLGQLQTMTFSDNGGVTPGPGVLDGHRTTTIFTIDPHWLNGVKVKGAVGSIQLIADEQEEIEWSYLTVTYSPTPVPVPAPGAALLAVMGMALVNRLQRRL
jgi:hypothetical protein